MTRYYDLDGNPVDEATGQFLFATAAPIAYDTLAGADGPVEVSTIFLSADRGSGDEPPLIFETMVFGAETPPPCERWPTLDEAKRGHAGIVARLQGGSR
ncbi:hypothetical protein [Glutamicibacter sp. V16R2B1]|uniref:hypothetical protein n=1 Tax=Glutamicibacter sp. V16R2B1 TaxID=2036207 RepID=UPI0010FEDB88|nr:hypothetical protein [Glutamicibacter sp. V16R2B1]MCK9901344.1 hypothetical protein [Frankia sp. Cpl3]TLK47804.1 hypothetical protein FDN03_15590 [Glutamicibacter sp. V16R2B1]